MNKAEEVLKLLLSRKIHQHGGERTPSKNPRSKEYNFFLERIEQFIRKGGPIEFVLGYGYCKNLNACDSHLPDRAEEMSFEFLVEIHQMVSKIYWPGIIINVITSGERAIFANNFPEDLTHQYHERLRQMISSRKEFSQIIRLHKIGDLWKGFPEFQSILQKKVEEIRKNIQNDPTLLLLMEYARRNIYPPPKSDVEILEAVIRFVATFETERELRVYESRFPGAIMMSYRPNKYYGVPTLLIWTTRKGDITQPWQGCWSEKKQMVITQARKRFFQ
jgi:hypothetical protein